MPAPIVQNPLLRAARRIGWWPLRLLMLGLLFWGLQAARWWQVAVVDFVVFLGVVAALVYVVRRMRQARTDAEFDEHAPDPWIVAGAVFTVFVAYAALRNQTMTAAEDRISTAGYELLKLEMEKDSLYRCVYDWGDGDARSDCRQKIVQDPHAWSVVQLYIEEVIFLLRDAKALKRDFGSRYYDEIKYWVDDVSADPTGMFGYYAVYRQGGEVDGATLLESAGAKSEKICERYLRIRQQLVAAGRSPEHSYCGLQKPQPPLPDGTPPARVPAKVQTSQPSS